MRNTAVIADTRSAAFDFFMGDMVTADIVTDQCSVLMLCVSTCLRHLLPLIHDQLTLKLTGGVNFTVIDVTLVMIFVIITCKGVVIDDYGMYRGAEPTIVPSVMVHRLSKKVL